MAEPAIHRPQKTRQLHNHHFDSTIWNDFEHCSFDYMKSHANISVPLGRAFWKGGAETFIHRGINGRWRDVLAPEDCAAYEAKARAELGENCARRLAGGPGVA